MRTAPLHEPRLGQPSLDVHHTVGEPEPTLRLHSGSFWGSYLETYKGIPKMNYYGASG